MRRTATRNWTDIVEVAAVSLHAWGATNTNKTVGLVVALVVRSLLVHHAGVRDTLAPGTLFLNPPETRFAAVDGYCCTSESVRQ